MGYYRGGRGDYYRGDYYRGDPFLGSILKGAGKLIAGGIKRTIGGIRNDGARRARDVLVATGIGAAIPPILQGNYGNPAPGLQVPGTGITIHPTDMFPGGAPGIDWGMKKRYRKMNPLNPRALKRALRRAEGFEKFAARTVNALYKTVGGRRTRVFKKGCK